jgi:xanthine dehydrogenase YagS FAD-binding subunit
MGESGQGDLASSGQNQYHAIFDNRTTSMVHASTPATALVAYNASVELVSGDGKRRTVPVREFFLPADFQTGRVTTIEPGEVLTQVVLPPLPAGTKSAYHKQTERDSYDWPICDVAVALEMQGGTIRAAAIAMGWVAPIPRRAMESERILAGKSFNDTLAQEAARAAVAGATPLSKNAYKVPILEAVVRRTIQSAAAA